MDIRPLGDWIVVAFAPLEKRSSIVELVGQNESAIRKGVVKLAGPGKRIWKTGTRAPMEVEVGDNIVFLRWHQEHRPGKAVSETIARLCAELKEDLCMIRQSDVLFKYTGDIRVDI